MGSSPKKWYCNGETDDVHEIGTGKQESLKLFGTVYQASSKGLESRISNGRNNKNMRMV